MRKVWVLWREDNPFLGIYESPEAAFDEYPDIKWEERGDSDISRWWEGTRAGVMYSLDAHEPRGRTRPA